MELGGLVESQMRLAIYALSQFSAESANQVIETELRVNGMELEIDRELSSIIARRQPTARDLRLLIAISKTTANLERAGDEAAKIARMVKSIIDSGASRTLPSTDLRVAADLASGLLRKALDAFARLDTAAAVSILKEDDQIDAEFDGFVRKLITYMMEDPRTISASLDLLFIAKAIERVGDHAKNIAEFIIYIVKGADVRHSSDGADRVRRQAMMKHLPRVLIVEDEPAIAELIAVNLRHNGFSPVLADDSVAAQRELDAVLPDVILLDWMLPGQSGLALARQLAQAGAHPRHSDPDADGARRRARQGGRARRGRRRLHHQAFFHAGTAGAHPRRAAPPRARVVSDSVTVGELVLDAATHRMTYQGQDAQAGADRVQAAALPDEARRAGAQPQQPARQGLGRPCVH